MSVVPICERLRAVESAKPEWHDGPTTCWHRNPDGPEAADILEFCELTLTEARQFVEHYPVHSKQDQHGKTLMLEQIDAALAKVTP